MTERSRRRFLGLVTGVGATAVGFGAFTDRGVAYTNDATMTTEAGIDLQVAWRAEYNGAVVESRDDPEALPLALGNVLPGDSGALSFRVALADSEPGAATVTATFDNTDADGAPVNAENGRNQPELEAGDTTPHEGELLDAIRARVWADVGVLGVSFLGACDGDADATEVIASGSLRDVLAEFRDGVPVSRGGCLSAEEAACVGLEWWVDASTGNQIQGDSVDLSLAFTATECERT